MIKLNKKTEYGTEECSSRHVVMTSVDLEVLDLGFNRLTIVGIGQGIDRYFYFNPVRKTSWIQIMLPRRFRMRWLLQQQDNS
jgi:hypothetical protein